jgi:hypothetical protein
MNGKDHRPLNDRPILLLPGANGFAIAPSQFWGHRPER